NASAFAFQILAKLTPANPEPTPEPIRNTGQEQLKPTNSTGQEQHMSTTSPKPTDALEVFYSYALEDENYAKKLRNHLVILKREGEITDWYVGKIALGEEFDKEKMRHLDTANIIFLLISDDFLASEQTYDTDVKRAMERH